MDDYRRFIEEGYDKLDETYRAWVAQMLAGYRAEFLAEVLSRIPSHSDLLEIGCGPGTDALALAKGRRYTGIDLSRVQLDYARRLLPDAVFLHLDVLEAEFPDASFDAVVSFYALNHIPQSKMPQLFRQISRWLRPGGWFCASLGASDNPGAVQERWLDDVPMYFSSLRPEENELLLQEVGFALELSKSVTEDEPGEGRATFHWVIARKTDA